jgi:hypothetical protein
MTDKPTKYPRWAYSGTRTDPSDAIRAVGHQAGVPPKAAFENFDRDLIDQWLQYYGERFTPTLTTLEQAATELEDGEVAIVSEDNSAAAFLMGSVEHDGDTPTRSGRAIASNGRYVVLGTNAGQIHAMERDGSTLWDVSPFYPDAITGIALNETDVYVTSGNAVKRIGLSDGLVVDTYTLPVASTINCVAIWPDRSYIYIGHDYDSTLGSCISRLDPSNLSAGPDQTDAWSGSGTTVTGIVCDGQLVWACGSPSGTSVVLREYSSVLNVLWSWSHPGGGVLQATCLTHDRERLYVGLETTGAATPSVYALAKNQGNIGLDAWTLTPAQAWVYDQGVDSDCLAIHCDGRFVYALYDDGVAGSGEAIKVLDVRDGIKTGGQDVSAWSGATMQARSVYSDHFAVWIGHDGEGGAYGDKAILSKMWPKAPPAMVRRFDALEPYRVNTQIVSVMI